MSNDLNEHVRELADLQKMVSDFEERDDYKAYTEAKKLMLGVKGIVRMSAMADHLETGTKALHTHVKVQSRKAYQYDADKILTQAHDMFAGNVDGDYDDSIVQALQITKDSMLDIVGMALHHYPDAIELNLAVVKKQMAKGNEWLRGLYTETIEPYVVISSDLSDLVDEAQDDE